ncbi:unnamed protein product [Ectocarpus fasciculatus]
MHAPSNSLLMLDPPHSRCGRRLVLFTGALLLPAQQQPLLDGSIGCYLEQRPASNSGGSVVGPAAATAGGGRIPIAMRHSYCRRSIDALFAAGALAEEKHEDEGAERSQQKLSNRDDLQHDPQQQQCHELSDDGQQLAQDSGRIVELTGRKRWQHLRPMALARALGRALRGNRRSGLNSGATPQHTKNKNSGAEGGGLLRRWRARRRQGRGRRRSDPADGHLAAATDEVEKRTTAEADGGGGKHRASIRESGKIQADGDPTAAFTATAAAAVVAVASDGGSGVGSANSSVVVNDAICVGVDGSGAALRPGKYDGEDVSPEAWTKVGELRARAERSDPNAGEEEKGLHTWLATGGGEGRKGLTDMDLLRFVMFRHGDVDAAWRQVRVFGPN